MSTPGDSGSRVDAGPPGIDVDRATAWLAGHARELVRPLTFTRIGEGQSNLTFLVSDGQGRRLVLRRPPLGGLLPSAHDMRREYRIQVGLAGAGAPVPRMLALCEDTTIVGAPFYLMAHVDGVIMTSVHAAERLTPAARALAARNLASTLARLHAIDLDAIGLGDFRRSESLASRQLRRWARQWDASRTRELALIGTLSERLGAAMPQERESLLVHGDYRLDNVVFGLNGRVLAVLDWELCSVGDPLADVGLMVAYWGELGAAARAHGGLFREPVTEAAGFPDAIALAGEYSRAAGRSLETLPYWVAFAYWKLAIIVEGIYRRWLDDPANGSDAGRLAPAVPRLAATAQRVLDSGIEAV